MSPSFCGTFGYVETHGFHARDGIELAYRELGEGRTVVLLHGFLSNAVDTWVRFGHAEEIAARGCRVVMPDLRGHGDSDRPHDSAAYPADVLADDGLALVEHLGPAEFDLAGYSLGGRVVARMLARGAAPRRAVVAGQGLGSVAGRGGQGGGDLFRRVLASGGGFEPGSVEWDMEEYLRSSGGDPVALLQVLETLVPTPPEALAGIEAPTLVLVGSEDGRQGEALAAALPRGSYAEVPGDHTTAVTNPARLGAAIADFLRAPVRPRADAGG